MLKKELHLFVLTRPSRADHISIPSKLAKERQLLERNWMTKIGVQIEEVNKYFMGSPTQCTSTTDSSTSSGTETVHNGKVDDCSSDTKTDYKIDMVNDDEIDKPTGGIVEIPFG